MARGKKNEEAEIKEIVEAFMTLQEENPKAFAALKVTALELAAAAGGGDADEDEDDDEDEKPAKGKKGKKAPAKKKAKRGRK